MTSCFDLVLGADLGLSIRGGRRGARARTRPLFPNQRDTQRDAVQLLQVEKQQELQRVHRQLYMGFINIREISKVNGILVLLKRGLCLKTISIYTE